MIKAVFFDIDSTTYLHAIHDNPPSTKLAFKKLKEKGIKMAICTSRTPPELACLPADFINAMDAIICSAGASIYQNGVLVEKHEIDMEDAKMAIKLLDEHNLVYRWNYTDKLNYLSVDSKEIQDRFYGLYKMYPPTRKWNNEVLTHILYYTHDEALSNLIASKLVNSSHLSLGYGNEISAKGIDKGTGIASCSALWGIDMKKVAAFGDGVNDIAMIKAAGIGIALGNAHESLKAVADYVTDNIEDDGLYNACIHYGWIEKEN